MFFTAVGICKFAALVKIVFYMEWMYNLFFGGGIGHSILLVATVIFMGILLGKIKIAGISLGITWILFVGIFFSHFNMRMDPEALVIEAFSFFERVWFNSVCVFRGIAGGPRFFFFF